LKRRTDTAQRHAVDPNLIREDGRDGFDDSGAAQIYLPDAISPQARFIASLSRASIVPISWVAALSAEARHEKTA